MKLKSGILGLIMCFAFGYQLTAQDYVPGPEGITTIGTDTIFCPNINLGDTVYAVFYIKNYGTEPVKIYQVHPGCQCTTPEFHDTIYPGQADSIVLVFYSKNNHEDHFMKGAIVLNNVQEKNYFVAGTMITPAKGAIFKNKKIRLNNLPKKK